MHKDKVKGMHKQLYRAILMVENEEECEKLFEDLFTISEINAAAQRLEVAVRLKNGGTCNGISEDMGVSTATVSRVNKCLNYGPGGYDLILERLKNNES